MRSDFVFASLAATVSLGVASTQAAFLTYVPQTGTNVSFTSITESSIEPTTQVPLNGLYNQPTVSMNTLVFDNLNLRAQSTGPRRDTDFSDFVDGQLNVTVQANPNFALSTLNVAEFGDYTLQQSVIAPARAYASVTVPVLFFRVLERNNVAVTPTTYTGTMNFNAPGREFFLNIIGNSDTVPSTGQFSGQGTLDIVALTGFDDVTKVAFSINNQLFAESTANASAAIAKKGFSLGVGSMVLVPEPMTLSGLAVAGGILLLRRRRA